MDRRNELEKYIEEYRAERINLKKGKLAEIKTKLQPVFCEKLNFLIRNQQIKKREEHGEIENLYLCRLLSSGYTGSYECIIGLSNSQLFLDKNKSQTYWCPKHIYKGIENDMQKTEKRLEKKFMRIEEYELLYLKQLLIMDDWELMKDSFHELVQEHLDLLTDSSLDLEPELKVMCGNYMDQLQMKSSFHIERTTGHEES